MVNRPADERRMYLGLSPHERAVIDIDALPKDSKNYYIQHGEKRVAQLRNKFISQRAESNPQSNVTYSDEKLDLIREAYRCKVAADAHFMRDEFEVAMELYGQEMVYLGRAKELP